MKRFGRTMAFATVYAVVWAVVAGLCVDLERITQSAHDAGSEWWHSSIFYYWAGNILRETYPGELVGVGVGIGFLSAFAHRFLWMVSKLWSVTQGDSAAGRVLLVGLTLGLCVGGHFGYSLLSWLGWGPGIGGIVLGCLPFLAAGSVSGIQGRIARSDGRFSDTIHTQEADQRALDAVEKKLR